MISCCTMSNSGAIYMRHNKKIYIVGGVHNTCEKIYNMYNIPVSVFEDELKQLSSTKDEDNGNYNYITANKYKR